MKQDKKMRLILFFILLVQIIVCLYFGTKKVNYQVDELFTYELANSTHGSTIIAPTGELLTNSDFFLDYLTVSEDNRFNYANVWINQGNDVHPPLYYALIHTVSSFFPNTFSKWIGIGINIVLSLISTIVIFNIFKLFIQNEYLSLFFGFIWGISSANVNSVIFIRMYTMLTMCVLIVTLLHLQYKNKLLDRSFYIKLFLISVLGSLTHYYFLIYLFFICLYFGICILFYKKYKDAIKYILTMAFSGIICIIIFPKMILHIFTGDRGTEAFSNFSNFQDYLNRLRSFYSIFQQQIFAGFGVAILLCILLLLLVCIKKYKIISKYNLKNFLFSKYFMLSFSTIGYFAIISKISAYITDRYIMPVFPLTYILITVGLFKVFNLMLKKQGRILSMAVCFFLVLSCYRTNQFEYLYTYSKDFKQFSYDNKNDLCICVFDVGWRLHSSYLELKNYRNIIYIQEDGLDILNDIDYTGYDEIIVYLINQEDEATVIKDILNKDTELASYEKCYNYIYESVYELY